VAGGTGRRRQRWRATVVGRRRLRWASVGRRGAEEAAKERDGGGSDDRE
jgi:hypothetical protein